VYFVADKPEAVLRFYSAGVYFCHFFIDQFIYCSKCRRALYNCLLLMLITRHIISFVELGICTICNFPHYLIIQHTATRQMNRDMTEFKLECCRILLTFTSPNFDGFKELFMSDFIK